jgi:hypothetical protein
MPSHRGVGPSCEGFRMPLRGVEARAEGAGVRKSPGDAPAGRLRRRVEVYGESVVGRCRKADRGGSWLPRAGIVTGLEDGHKGRGRDADR